MSKEEQAALAPGLLLEYFKPGESEPADARRVRLAALHVPAATHASPLFESRAFTARLSGYLKLPLKGEFTFLVRGTGKVALRLNGVDTLLVPAADDATKDVATLATAPVALVKGFNRVEVDYQPTATAAASLRVWWRGSDFSAEPLPPEALFTRSDGKTLAAATALRAGRELFALRSCQACHAPDKKVSGMPELEFSPPNLAGVGSRLNASWLQAWIANPRALRPTATMPDLLTSGDEKEKLAQAADLAAYLQTLEQTTPPEEAPAAERATAEIGLKLWENLGCMACHHTQPPDFEDPYARRTLHYVNTKFAPGQLASFLRAPQRHYAWSRMPDFKLANEEAAALATHLQSAAAGALAASPAAPGDARRGEKLFHEVGCANCHETRMPAEAAQREAFARLTLPAIRADALQGCLADADQQRGRAPQFHFSADQRAALAALLTTGRHSLQRVDPPFEASLRQVQALNCVACHRRDGASSIQMTVFAEEGSQGLAAELLPALTFTGEKLKPAWSEKFIAGHMEEQARPWLKARMPAFPTRAKLIAAGLSHEHGFAVDEDERPAPSAELAKVGQTLLGDVGGFNCVKCHAVGSKPAVAPFEAPGINLANAAQRLRYSYYPRWMLDPPRVDVITKMPKFAADGRTTGITTVYEGDAAKQYLALWHYIQTLSP